MSVWSPGVDALLGAAMRNPLVIAVALALAAAAPARAADEGCAASACHDAPKYEQACRDEEAIGCEFLADMYAEGLGVQRNLDRAAQLYRMACQLGSEEACATYEDLAN